MSIFGPPNVEKLKAKGDIPGLIKALSYKKDSDVRRLAAAALGEIRDRRAVDPLVAALEDSHAFVRAAAASALGKIQDARAVVPLVRALEEREVKEVAAKALVEFGSRAVTPLGEVLKSNSFRAPRKEAVQVLGQIGSAAVPTLAEALRDLDTEHLAAEMLASIGVAAVPPLLEHLKLGQGRPSRERLAPAAAALVKIGQPAVEPLIAALKDSGIGYLAARLLGEIGDTRSVEPLAETLKGSGDLDVRREAARALAKTGGRRVAGALVVALEDADGDIRLTAAKGLKARGWQPADANQRVLYAIAAQRWDDVVAEKGAAIGALTTAVEKFAPSGGARENAVEALGKIGGPRAADLLAAMADNAAHDLNLAAAKALVELGDARAARALVKVTHDPSHAIQAVDLLGQLLERAAASTTADDLHAVAGLRNVVSISWRTEWGSCGQDSHAVDEPVDCSHILQLARQELIRRGLEA